MIPNRIIPAEDELLYSFLSRTAIMNGFSSAAEFINAFSGKSTYRLSIDGRDDMRILQKFPFLSDTGVAYSQFTIFNAVAPFMNYIQQLRMVRPMNNNCSKIKPLFHAFHYCPVCMADDIKKYGVPVYHRAHQIPGVIVCYIHQTLLYEYTGKYGQEFNLPIPGSKLKSKVTDKAALQYAVFAAGLLRKQSGLLLDDTKKIIAEKDIERKMQLPSTASSHAMLNAHLSYMHLSVQDGISILMSLFPDAESFYASASHLDLGKVTINMLLNEDRYVFLSKPTVRTIRSIDSCRQDVADLTGNEYTLVDFQAGTNSSVTLMHNICNTTHTYSATHFLQGQRCPICSAKMIRTDLPIFINKRSGNRYRFVSSDGNVNIVLADKTDGKYIVIPRQYAVQELSRPTPSTILPRSEYSAPQQRKSQRQILMDYLIEKYRIDDLIILSDIHLPPFSANYISNAVRDFAKQKLLVNVAYGTYTFSAAHISPMDVVRYRYMEHNNHKIGYISAESFAYNIGLLQREPQFLRLASNLYAGSKAYPVTIAGIQCLIAHPRVTVTDSNATCLAILDIFAKFERYHDGSEQDALQKLSEYIVKQGLVLNAFEKYLDLYQPRVRKRVEKLLQILEEYNAKEKIG